MMIPQWLKGDRIKVPQVAVAPPPPPIPSVSIFGFIFALADRWGPHRRSHGVGN